MQNRTENDRPATLEEDAAPTPEIGTPCPNGVSWCRRHDTDGDYCWSRTVVVNETCLDLTNGTHDGRTVLFGLHDFEGEHVDLDTARQVAAAITELLDEGEEMLAPPAETARFTWRDLVAENATLRARNLLYSADRTAPPFGTDDLRSDLTTYPAYGGMLAWNLTRDEEGGHLVMFTGQTRMQERQVIDNAAWLVSCGAVYAAERVGMRGWKTSYDDRCTAENGDELLVWLLPNDLDISAETRSEP